jgi:hypothetical protein
MTDMPSCTESCPLAAFSCLWLLLLLLLLLPTPGQLRPSTPSVLELAGLRELAGQHTRDHLIFSILVKVTPWRNNHRSNSPR